MPEWSSLHHFQINLYKQYTLACSQTELIKLKIQFSTGIFRLKFSSLIQSARWLNILGRLYILKLVDFYQWAPHIPGVRTLVAESEAKDDGNWTATVRQFQSPNSRGQVISLFLAGNDGPENPRIFAFFFILRVQKWEKIYSSYKNLFPCIYPIWVP